jgi:hypothetical protein
MAGETNDLARASKLRSALFAPETLAKASIGGKATPFGIENITLNTNLLELIEQHGGSDGADFLTNLAKGNHMAQTDTILTNYMAQFILDGRLDLAQGTAHLPQYLKDIRRSIAKAAPPTPTTNIAHAQHMSDAVFNYATQTEEGMRGVKLSTDTGSIISYSGRRGSFIESLTDRATGEVSETVLDKSATQARIQQQMLMLKDDALKGSSEVIDSGISYGQQSRMLGVLAGISKGSGISPTLKTSPMDLVEAMMHGGDADIDQRLIEGLAATREQIGFTDFSTRPDIFQKTEISRNISKTFGIITEAQKDSYLETLSKSGIGGVIDDPYLRRNFVELATMTSSVPYNVPSASTPEGYAASVIKDRHLAKQLKASALGETLDDLTDTELMARVNQFNKVGRSDSKLLSEFGVSHFEEQQFARLYGMSPDEVSRVMLPASIVKDIEVTGSDGLSKYKLLSDEFMADHKANKFGLSAVDTPEGKIINVVLGDLALQESNAVIGHIRAVEIADQGAEKLKTLVDGKTAQELVDLGHFSDVSQARMVTAKLKDGIDVVKREMYYSLRNRGLATHNITGDIAEGAKALMEEIGDNDVLPAQRGINFSMSEAGEGYGSFQGRIDDTTTRILDMGTTDDVAAAAKIRSGEAAQEVTSSYRATSGRMAEDSGFLKGLKKNFSSKGLGRSLRDDNIREAYQRLKPKIGLAALGVGVAAAGYYMYNKSQESNMYDETMEDQPIEANGQIRRANSSFQSSAGMTSSRRDPLTTAGVVGNLDRNKIGHTRMGPDKYNHLYGG